MQIYFVVYSIFRHNFQIFENEIGSQGTPSIRICCFDPMFLSMRATPYNYSAET